MTLRRAAKILLAAGILAMAGPARAQNEGPIVVGTQREKVDKFHIERPEIVLKLLGRYNSDSIQPTGGTRTDTNLTQLQELITLSTNGHLYHPNLFNFNVTGTFGLEQVDETQQGESKKDNGDVYEYNLAATLLGTSKAPLSGFAARTVQLTAQPFSVTLQNTSNNYGLNWDLQSKTLPTSLRVHHNDMLEHSIDGSGDYSYDQNGAEWQTEAILGERSRLNWSLTYNNEAQQDSNGTNTTFDTLAAILSHRYEFGLDHRSSINSLLDYFNQAGDFAQERLRWDERLNWWHTDHFETLYQLGYNQQTYTESETNSQHASVGFRHSLYNSLVTSGRAGVILQDQNGAGTQDYSGELAFDYTKKIPYGILAATIAFGLEQQNNEAQSSEVHVQETQSFGLDQQIDILRQNIVDNSIRVRSADGSRLYANKRDYLTRYLGTHAVVERVVGGNIPPGAPVLLDYDVMAQPANDVATDTFNTGLRYEIDQGILKGLGVYTRYLMQNQSISSSQPGALIPNNVRELVYGADYRIWALKLTAEHVDHEGDILPFASNRFAVRYEDRLGTDWKLSLDANRLMTDYPDTGNRSESTGLSGYLEYRPSRQLVTSLTVSWLDLNDDLIGSNRGLEEKLDLAWSHRQTTVHATIRHATLDADTQESSFLFFELSIERKF